MRRWAKVFVSWGSVLGLILVMVPSLLRAQEPGKGNLVGFVFDRDGSTPVEGAVVLVKNLTSGAVTEAPQSDGLGMFKVASLDVGLYALGVKSKDGNFNSQDFFGISAERTSKISIALTPYEPEAAAAAVVVAQGQNEKGEAFIGKVLTYVPETREAQVLIEIGLLRSEDRIHVKGQTTDFYQDMRTLKFEGTKVKRVLSGQTALIWSSKACQTGDFIYVVCKGGVPPFFLLPLGAAAIVAGATPLSAVYEEEPVSAFKIK